MPEIKSLAAKNHSIELVRIIACLLVIMAHSQLSVVEENAIVNGRLAFSTIIADDVPLFLLVTGFFLFGRIKSDADIIPTFPYKAKSFLSRVYIPTIVYILISIFYRYFSNLGPNSTILDADWNYLWRFIFRLAPGDHLWYICTYMSFIFFFPMLAFVCQDNPQKNKLRHTLLAVAIAGAVVGDIQYFFKMSMFELDKFLWGYCTIFLILGNLPPFSPLLLLSRCVFRHSHPSICSSRRHTALCGICNRDASAENSRRPVPLLL